MKIIALAAALLAISSPALADERRYSVTDFDKVEVDGPYRVTLATGRSSSAISTGSRQAIDQVSIDVQGRTLRIRRNRSAWGGYPGESVGPVAIALTTRDLRSATVNGSGSLDIDKARGLRIELIVAGSGRMGVAGLDADILNIGLVGSGVMKLSGHARVLRAAASGTGNIEASTLVADDAQITADTAGTFTVGASRTAKIKAIGTGDVEIIGSPACTVDATGSGAVRCGGN